MATVSTEVRQNTKETTTKRDEGRPPPSCAKKKMRQTAKLKQKTLEEERAKGDRHRYVPGQYTNKRRQLQKDRHRYVPGQYTNKRRQLQKKTSPRPLRFGALCPSCRPSGDASHQARPSRHDRGGRAGAVHRGALAEQPGLQAARSGEEVRHLVRPLAPSSSSVDAEWFLGRCRVVPRSMPSSSSVDAEWFLGRCRVVPRSMPSSSSVDAEWFLGRCRVVPRSMPRMPNSGVPPEELLFQRPGSGATLQLASHYYILKSILPALDRVLAPIGVDVKRCAAPNNKTLRLGVPTWRPSASM
eukprot:scaffold2884_cov56-Isochrysis_galbana.AAC.2